MAKLCVALDVRLERARRLVEELADLGVVFKVGQALTLEGGPTFFKEIKSAGCELFLDLKLHDIPTVVRIAVERAEDMGADYITLHVLGGAEMVGEAKKGADSIKLLGVTLLTSHDRDYLKYLRSEFGEPGEFSLYLAKRARELGLYGVVCSGREVKPIKEGTGLFTVVPGIRFSQEREDQKRVSSFQEVLREGADMLVVGREVYRNTKPRNVVLSMLERLRAHEQAQRHS